MAVKKSFVLYHDNREQIELLSDEQAGRLLKALMQYSECGIVPDFSDPMLKMVFSFLASQIRRDTEKYEETCRKRSENGKKGGASTKNKNAAKTSKSRQKQAKQADNDSDSVSDRENENENEKENENDTVCDSDTSAAHGTAHTARNAKQLTLQDVLALARQFGFTWTEKEAQDFIAYNIDKGRTTGWGYAVQRWEENRQRLEKQKKDPSAPTPEESGKMSKYLALVNRFKEDGAHSDESFSPS